MVRVPRLERLPDGRITVVQWGQVGDLLLRVGDHLLVGDDHGSGLLVLVPNGRGRPMLGRFGKRGLVAEPGGVPASNYRWRVLGALHAVERSLERSGLETPVGHVAVRIDGDDLAATARARTAFVGGSLTVNALAQLCNRGAVAPEHFGVSIAIAVARDQAVAEAMVRQVPSGRIRRQVMIDTEDRSGHGVVVPGPWLEAAAHTPAQDETGIMQLGLFGSGRQTG
jgi:hypothetical protein